MDKPYYNFSLNQLRCWFTTRDLGNLTFARARRDDVLENYRRLEAVTGIPPQKIVRPYLDNGVGVARVDQEDAGRGVLMDAGRLQGIDAIYTNVPNLYISLTTADCFALVLHDQVKNVLGIAHCGWRGIVGRLDEKLFQAMARDFGSRAQDILAVVGPGIRSCCYQQHDDGLRQAFAAYSNLGIIQENADGTYNIDIALPLRSNLDGLGIRQIVDTQLCTGCNTDFYSARREGFTTGRMLNIAVMSHPGTEP